MKNQNFDRLGYNDNRLTQAQHSLLDTTLRGQYPKRQWGWDQWEDDSIRFHKAIEMGMIKEESL